MNYQMIEIEVRSSVAHVWINRPHLHNAFDETTIAELTEVFDRLDRNQAVRVVVLGGRGKSFSAGADLGWMQRAATASEADNIRDALAFAKMLQALDRLSKPTVARVHGAAIGGGMGLVAACDIALAAPSATFGTTEVRLGLAPAVIAPYVVRAVGERNARRCFLTGERISAAEAFRMGMLHEVCAGDALDPRIDEIVGLLLLGAPDAQGSAKKLVSVVAKREIDADLIAETARAIAQLRAGAEAREGIAAFLGKRRPGWHP